MQTGELPPLLPFRRKVGGGASRFSLLYIGDAGGELVGCVLCIRNNDTEVNKVNCCISR